MKHIKTPARLLAVLLALLLLSGCGAVAPSGTEPGEATPIPGEESAGEGVVRVSTVDELLDAIVPGATIELEAGTYDLSTASNYGKRSNSGCYGWLSCGDGYALEIRYVDDLTIRGEGAGMVTISAVPRGANVLRFVACGNLTLVGVSLGHTKEPGICAGGVLDLERCDGCTVDRCGLFGCGTVGVSAASCKDLRVMNSEIYECSWNAVSLYDCKNTRVTDCTIDSCGKEGDYSSALLLLSACDGALFTGCRIYNNHASLLLECSGGSGLMFLSNRVEDNELLGVFNLRQFGVTVDGCSFYARDPFNWYPSSGVLARDAAGEELDGAALEAMSYRQVDPAGVVLPEQQAAVEVEPGAEIEAATVDEFLAALGPDRTIVLTGSYYDLSTASTYGFANGLYYWWRDCFDGPGLVVDGVDGLTIRAASDDAKATVISAAPRYADVLEFDNCQDLTLSGFTAGHTKEPGSCSGGVLYFNGCSGVAVEGCRLYGCGILGVSALNCADLKVFDTEIFECSQGAAEIGYSYDIRFEGCKVRDVPSPALSFTSCAEVRWNGSPLDGWSRYDLPGGNPLLLPVG